jgi:ATP synthase subunit 6
MLFFYVFFSAFDIYFLNFCMFFGIVGFSSNNLVVRTYTYFFFILTALYNLSIGILRDNVFLYKNTNISFIFFLFLSLLAFNIAGLFPFTFTVTSSFVVTLFLSLTVFLAANIIGLYYNGFGLLVNFLPTGTPLFIAPLLILIEIISYFSRIFSLSIRLFANMMSGHGLLKILIGFSFLAFKTLEF